MVSNPLELLRPLIYKTVTNTDLDGRAKLSRTLNALLMGLSDSPGKFLNWKDERLMATSEQLVQIASFYVLSGNIEELTAIVEHNKHQFLYNGTTLDNMYMTFLLGLPVAKVLAPLMLLLLLFERRSLKKTVMIFTLCAINKIIYLPSERTLRFLQEPL